MFHVSVIVVPAFGFESHTAKFIQTVEHGRPILTDLFEMLSYISKMTHKTFARCKSHVKHKWLKSIKNVNKCIN